MSKSMRNLRRRLRNRVRGRLGDRGVSALEYVGMVIIVAAIIIAIRGLGLDATISSAIAKAVSNITGG